LAFTIDLFWDILRSAAGTDQSTLTDTMNSLAKDEDVRSDIYFGNVIDQLSYNTADYKRLRKFLVDLYSAHKTVVKTSATLSDPFSMSNSDLDELFRSFGYDYSVTLRDYDENPLTNKVALMNDLVNLYKVKGTPQALVDVLQYYGLSEVDIFEFFIRLESTTSTIFRGRAIAGTTINPGILDVDYEEFTSTDPHWMYTEQQILDLHDLNKINLPSKTPYIGIRPVIDAQGPESAILSRIIQDQYGVYSSGGTLPENAEVRTTGEITSLLSLYLSVLYVFNKYYPTGVNSDLFVCYDGTSTNYLQIKSEYEVITEQPKTREQILMQLDEYYDQFNRIQPSNFLQNIGDAETILSTLNPTLKTDIDNLLDVTPSLEILSSLINDLSLWVRNNIGFGFINFAYMVDGLSAFFKDLKPVVNFFKPYRARFILLEALQFKNRLFNTIVVEDTLGTIDIEHKVYDFATGDGIPCCAAQIDSTDVSTICIDSTGSNLYYQRDTYDCGSYFDIGAATDIPLEVQIYLEDKYYDPLVCVPWPEIWDGTAYVVIPSLIVGNNVIDEPIGIEAVIDGTSETIVVGGDITPFQDATSNTNFAYARIQTGGMADYDAGGTFDCVAGQDLCVIIIEDVTGSTSSSSISSSSTSSSFSFSSSCSWSSTSISSSSLSSSSSSVSSSSSSNSSSSSTSSSSISSSSSSSISSSSSSTSSSSSSESFSSSQAQVHRVQV